MNGLKYNYNYIIWSRIFVNRDVNACKNILLLGKCYLESQTRPEEFTRKVIKSEKVKKPKKQASKNK